MSYSEIPSNATAEDDTGKMLQKKRYENTHQPYRRLLNLTKHSKVVVSTNHPNSTSSYAERYTRSIIAGGQSCGGLQITTKIVMKDYLDRTLQRGSHERA